MLTSLSEIKHYRLTKLVPTKFQSRVCMCEEYHGVSSRYRRMNYCAKCQKPYRWYLRRCVGCKEWYIKDFRIWAKECPRHSKCWDCIQGNRCECLQAVDEPRPGDFSPLGLNPKRFTSEELAEFDPLAGPF